MKPLKLKVLFLRRFPHVVRGGDQFVGHFFQHILPKVVQFIGDNLHVLQVLLLLAAKNDFFFPERFRRFMEDVDLFFEVFL